MKTYNTQEELEADIVDGVLNVCDDIKITFDLNTTASIEVRNIDAKNIDAYNIDAGNIDANSVFGHHITYHSFCIVTERLNCTSIRGRRENSIHACLDNKIIIRE